MKRSFGFFVVFAFAVASILWWKNTHKIQTQSLSSDTQRNSSELESEDSKNSENQANSAAKPLGDSAQSGQTATVRKTDSVAPPAQKSLVKNLSDLQKRFPKKDFKLLKNERGDVISMTGETDPYPVGVDGAYGFITEVSSVFDIDDPTQLTKPATDEKLPLGSRTTFQQTYDGVEVWAANVAVFQNDSGQVWLVNNSYVNGVRGTPTQPTLPYEVAKQFVLDDAGLPIDGIETHKNAQGVVTPVIVSSGAGVATLSWMLQIAQNQKGAVWLYFVDARSPAGAPRFSVPRRNTAVH